MMDAEEILAFITVILVAIMIAVMYIFAEKKEDELEAMLISHPECVMATRPRVCLRYSLKLERLQND